MEMAEEPLLLKAGQTKPLNSFAEELRKVGCIAAPMVVVTLSQYLLRVAPMLMVGHLSELSLSSVSIATSITNVTGYCLLFGMASALETLCGQAYGAKQYQKLGNYTYGAAITLLLVCIPISLLWMFMEELLVFLGQDPLISKKAGEYVIWLIPSLIPYAILESLVPYLQTQSLIFPMLLSSVATISFHVPLCWVLIFKFDLGTKGAALAISLSYWVNVILLGIYLKYSPACERSRVSFSKDVFPSIWEFLQFALPSAGMVCLEWWSFELLILMSGLLPNPQLESSVLSICLTTTSLHNLVPYSIGAASSTRVSNELGAGNFQAAQQSVYIVMVLAVLEAISVSTILFCCRSFLGYAYSYEKEVVEYVRDMTPILCVSITMDNIQAVLSGVATGSGSQHIGAYVNFGAFYLVGLPLATLLGFVEHLGGKGIWSGIAIGATTQVFLLSLVTSCTSWQKQADKARERIFRERIPLIVN